MFFRRALIFGCGEQFKSKEGGGEGDHRAELQRRIRDGSSEQRIQRSGSKTP